MIGITVTFLFHSLFSSLARPRYLSSFSPSVTLFFFFFFFFLFTLWSIGMAKSLRWKVLLLINTVWSSEWVLEVCLCLHKPTNLSIPDDYFILLFVVAVVVLITLFNLSIASMVVLLLKSFKYLWVYYWSFSFRTRLDIYLSFERYDWLQLHRDLTL